MHEELVTKALKGFVEAYDGKAKKLTYYFIYCWWNAADGNARRDSHRYGFTQNGERFPK